MATTAERAADVLCRPTGKLLTCWERKESPTCVPGIRALGGIVPVLGSEPSEGSHSWSEVQTPHRGNSVISCPQGLSPPHSAQLSLLEFHLMCAWECSGSLKKSLPAGRGGLCRGEGAE